MSIDQSAGQTIDKVISMRHAVFAMTAMALFALLPFDGYAAQNCRDLYEEIQASAKYPDTDKLKDFYERAALLPDCDGAFRAALGRQIAVVLVLRVKHAVNSGASAGDHVPDLEESLRYYRLWQVLALLGDIARDEGDHDKAALRFQEALQAIDDPDLTNQVPEVTVIEALVKKAETERLLAKNYVAAPRTRGKPTGLGAPGVRGFMIEKVAIPITFVFGKTELTHKGAAAASDMLEQLKAQGQLDITLVGHTDPVGSDAANQVLYYAPSRLWQVLALLGDIARDEGDHDKAAGEGSFAS